MAKYAHYENVFEKELIDLYSRHAEVSKQIHEDTLRKFTGNRELTVDLVRNDILSAETGMLDKLQNYDVVSVSSHAGRGMLHLPEGITTKEGVERYKERFSAEDMPVIVEAAGNYGKSENLFAPRISDFARNSLVVGEAERKDGKLQIETHSSPVNPTLAADNPFNRGERYQYFNTAPSLTGHEGLIRNWLVEQEADKRIQKALEENPDADYDEVNEKVNVDLKAELYEFSPGVRAKVKDFMDHPENLHQIMMNKIRTENPDVDEKGYVSKINGTSFSAPEQAGYVSGALYEQEQREAEGLPILTKDEITTLVKLSTVDNVQQAGSDTPMPVRNKSSGFPVTQAGGHGVFEPKLFRELLDESYKRIETNPDLDRQSVEIRSSGKFFDLKGDNQFSVRFSPDQDVLIDRTRFDMDFRARGLIPNNVYVTDPVTSEYRLQKLQMSSEPGERTAWYRDEGQFGQTLGKKDGWDFHLQNGKDTTIHSASVTVYGYNKGGFMDEMAQTAKDLQKKYEPDKTLTVTQEAAPETSVPQPAVDYTAPPKIK